MQIADTKSKCFQGFDSQNTSTHPSSVLHLWNCFLASTITVAVHLFLWFYILFFFLDFLFRWSSLVLFLCWLCTFLGTLCLQTTWNKLETTNAKPTFKSADLQWEFNITILVSSCRPGDHYHYSTMSSCIQRNLILLFSAVTHNHFSELPATWTLYLLTI